MRRNCRTSALQHFIYKPISWLGVACCIGLFASCTKRHYVETQLRIAVVGNGLVQSGSDQVKCTNAVTSWCTQNRTRGEDEGMINPITTLTAIPASDSIFVGWSGDCAGNAGCSVDMSNSNKSVTATFFKVAYKTSSFIHSNGDLSLAGTFHNAIDLGAGSLVSAGGVDIFLTKFSAGSGSTLWSIGFGGSGVDYPDSLTADGSGNLIITGYASGNVSFGSTQLDCSSQGGHFTATFAGNDGSYISSSCLASSW